MSITTLVIILILFGGVGGVGWYGGWYGPGPNPPAGGPAGPGPAYWNGGGIISLLVTILVVVFLLRALHVGI